MRRLPVLLAALALVAPVAVTGCSSSSGDGGDGGASSISDARAELLDLLRADGKEAGVPDAIVECMIDGSGELTDDQLTALMDDTQDEATTATANAILEACAAEAPAE
jgi:hypothetical protein